MASTSPSDAGLGHEAKEVFIMRDLSAMSIELVINGFMSRSQALRVSRECTPNVRMRLPSLIKIISNLAGQKDV